MAFWRKKDEKGQDLQAVKDRIGQPRTTPPVYAGVPATPRSFAPLPPPLPDVMAAPLPLPPLAPTPPQPVDEAVSHALHAAEFAPLFVKIDRYKEILEKLEQIKVSLHSLTDVMVLLNEVEHIRESTVKALRQGVTDLTDALIALDGEFVRPEEAEISVRKSRERTRVEQYVGDLQSELSNLKKELARIK